MKKLVNVRIPVLLALIIVFGIAIGCAFIYFSIDLVWITAAVPAAAVILIIKLFYRKSNYFTVTIILSFVIFIVGSATAYFKLANFDKSDIADKTNCSIAATICDKSRNARGEYIVLNNVYAGSEKISGKMIVILGELYGDYCDIGYTVEFSAVINKNRGFEYGRASYFLTENIKYMCNVYSGLKAKEGFTLFGSIRVAIRDMLFENLDRETAAVAYGMLTGNTQYIEDSALESFRYGGIAHIFAVSGLHIGIVYGMFYFLSKRFKLNSWASICLCILPVLFYAGICGFTPSCVRAAVMCTVALSARKFHKKYDRLNSLAVSVIIILLINPVSIFALGFQLSVFALGGIILLSSRLSGRFKRVPQKITGAVGISLGAQAGTLPVMLSNLGYLSGAGLLLNIVVIPVLSVEFIILFVNTAIALIIPYSASVLLPYAVLPLEATVSFFIDAGLERALIKGFGAGLFLPLYYLGLVIASDKINIKPLKRITALGCTAAMLVAYTLAMTFIPFYEYTVIISAYYGGGEVLIKTREGNVLIICDEITPARTGTFLNNNYCARLDAVILLGGDNCAFGYTDLRLDCDNVYIYDGYLPLQPFGNIQINYENEFSVCGIRFGFADGYSVLADCGGTSIAVCAGGDIPFGRCDILVSDVAENYCSCGYQISFNERNLPNCVYDDGDFVFNIKDVK